jgi:hypothetical protein
MARAGAPPGAVRSAVSGAVGSAGGGGGRLAAGSHVRLAEEKPMSNLFVTMLDLMGAPVERFGDSTGRLDDILA